MSDETTKQTAQPQEQAAPQAQSETAVVKKEKFTPELCASAISKLPAQLQPIKNCFAQPFDAFRNAFKDPKEADRRMAREVDFASQAMLANGYLVKVATSNPMSLVNALKNVAITGFSLNPVLKLGYLVPMGNAITFMPSYQGLVDKLAETGLVRKIQAFIVYEGEKFEVVQGSNAHIDHVPDPWGDKSVDKVKGGYWIATLADGTSLFDTMSKEEIEKIRKRAPSARSTSPWDSDWQEMAKKTLIRRAFKSIPKSGISTDKLKVLEALSDYDLKSDAECARQATPKRNPFDEGIEDVTAEEITEQN